MTRKMTLAVLSASGCMFLIVPGGCEGPPATPVEISSINHDLAIGATGPEVQAVTTYLTTYGYFPNAALQNKYPSWRPLVTSAPSSEDLFDGNEQKAVVAFQKNAGLPQTGVVDAATRALMATPRCEVPDGMPRLDPTNKWASENTTEGWTQTVNWYLQNNSSDLSTSSIVSDIQSMLNEWHQWSGYNFAQSSNNAEIIVSFANLASGTNAETGSMDCVVGICGSDTPGVPAPAYVQLNTARTWSDNGSPSSSQMDLPSILVHELGHALGLAHSSYGSAIMYPFFNNGNVKRSLTADDVEGIATTNPVYVNVGQPTGGQFVVRAVQNNHFNGPSIWALAGYEPGGYGIWELDGGWYQHPGGAVRIAVNTASNNNQPWVINNQNQVFRWDWGTQNWDNIPACATDIGIGTDDSVWVIGCNPIGSNGDYGIYKYNGDAACQSGNCWTETDGGATQITVGARSPSDATIVPWLINSYQNVFRRTTSDPTVAGAWETLPSLPTNTVGIAGSNGGYSYAINDVGSDYPTVYSWDEQPALSGGGPPPPAEKGWVYMGLGTTSPHPTAIAPAGFFPIMVANQSIWTVN